MPEAITKYAINSTLGTSDFKPLDKIIDEIYKNGKRFVVKDDSPKIIQRDLKGLTMEKIETIYFYPELSGHIKVFWSCSNYGKMLTMSFYENDELVDGGSTSSQASMEFAISKGKTYRINMSPRNSESQPVSGSVIIYASIEQLGFFSYNIVSE